MITPKLALEYITALVNRHPELHAQLSNIAELYQQKLWHQLTDEIEVFIRLPSFHHGNELILFYENFIKEFEARINQLRFTQIIITIARIQLADPNAALAFLAPILNKLKNHKEAYILLLSVMAEYKLTLNLIQECKETIELATKEMSGVTGADSLVYEAYYRVSAFYYKAKNSPVEFCKNALLYLACAKLEEIPIDHQRILAFDLAIASLVGENVYNFGELLANPILQSLRSTDREWMIEYLRAYNSGDITNFNKLNANVPQISAEHALSTNAQRLKEKISILALMELVFKRPSEDRKISFPIIAEATQLPFDEVELLVMKALSLKLIRGKIDEVEQSVVITWVQPRVLDLNQVGLMKTRLDIWIKGVQQTISVMNQVDWEF